jgi:hypothetical protein
MFFVFQGAGGRDFGNVVDDVLNRSIDREHSVKHDGGEIKLKKQLLLVGEERKKIIFENFALCHLKRQDILIGSCFQLLKHMVKHSCRN